VFHFITWKVGGGGGRLGREESKSKTVKHVSLLMYLQYFSIRGSTTTTVPLPPFPSFLPPPSVYQGMKNDEKLYKERNAIEVDTMNNEGCVLPI